MDAARIKKFREKIVEDPYYGQAINYALDRMGDLDGKHILEVGCGVGIMSIFFALQGARVIGVDIRVEAINHAIETAAKWNVSDTCTFYEGVAESMSVETSSVDILFSKSTIQYMQREKAFAEYKRVLKPTGVIVLIENLPDNLFIKVYRLYRRLVTRSKDRISYINSIRGYITFDEIKDFDKDFSGVTHEEYHFFRVLTLYFSRHKILYKGTKFIDLFLAQVDKLLFACFPFAKRFGWVTSIYGEVRNNQNS